MIVVIEHQSDGSLDLFAGWLADQPLQIVRPYLGDAVPTSVAGGLIVLGGEVDAYADAAAPWLPDVRRLLATAVAERVPTLGICLGSQLLAVAAGGVVAVDAPAGIEVGVVEVTWAAAAADDPLCAGLPAPFPSLAMHQDGVAALPPDAVLLGSTPRYPHQVFRVGQAAWGVQFHPEVSEPGFEKWAGQLDREVPDFDPAAVLPAVADRAAEIGEAGRLLARRFAAQL